MKTPNRHWDPDGSVKGKKAFLAYISLGKPRRKGTLSLAGGSAHVNSRNKPPDCFFLIYRVTFHNR
jgi:hypothetical protein